MAQLRAVMIYRDDPESAELLRKDIDLDSDKIIWQEDGPPIIVSANDADGGQVEGEMPTTRLHLMGGDVLWVEQSRAYWSKAKAIASTFGTTAQARIDRGML